MSVVPPQTPPSCLRQRDNNKLAGPEDMDKKAGSKARHKIQPTFKSDDLEELLDVIDNLRLQGITSLIDLPQLIVCGDQSSGKSSVLEALSGVSFPTKDNLCTRHPTELVLRRKPETNTTITIIPDVSRSNQEKQELSKFKAGEEALRDFGATIEAVGKLMGLQDQSRAFCTDVLRVELTGPNMPQLTLVDLPGLFHSGSKMQTDADAHVVKDMIIGYMRKKRSIILAVVSAKNDYVNQVVTKYARDVDPNGTRTLGIITKPDLLDAGSHSEKQYLELAENKDVVLRLGWHVIRNRDFKERNSSLKERDEAEAKFFASGIWASLGRGKLGIESLKQRLGRILKNHILIELPNLTRDVETGIKDCEERLARLGTPRGSTQEQRKYLHQISQEFCKIVQNAVDGYYTDQFFDNFSNVGYSRRIRAVVVNLLEDFARDMRTDGKQFKIVEHKGNNPDENPNTDFNGHIMLGDYLDHVAELMRQGRGRELPGFTRFEVIATLFKEQCRPWESMVTKYTENIFGAIRGALHAALDYTSDETTKEGILKYIINPILNDIKAGLKERVAQNLQQHINGHPITFNHYFTENIQKLRNEHQAKFLEPKLMTFFGYQKTTVQSDITLTRSMMKDLVAALTNNTMADMNKFACSEAHHYTEAYYKVALKFFVDDFSIHTIEQGLLQQLRRVFSQEDVFKLSDEEVEKIAGENEDSRAERTASSTRLVRLKAAIKVLRQLDHGQPKTQL